MRQQSQQHTCGAVALCNAIEALGEPALSEDKATQLADSSAIHGTQPAGLKRALKRLKLGYQEIQTKSAPIAYWALFGALETGNPVLMVVDNEEHWITAIGVLGSRVVIADSADAGTVSVVEYEALMKRWCAGDQFYGLVIGKP